METTLRKRPTQTRAIETVGAILEATGLVVAEHGAAGLTVREVARRAGVSMGTLYQYFLGRESLLAAWEERDLVAQCASVALAAAESGRQGGTPHEVIRRVVATAFDALVARFGTYRTRGFDDCALPYAERRRLSDTVSEALTVIFEQYATVYGLVRSSPAAARMTVLTVASAAYDGAFACGSDEERASLRDETCAMVTAYLLGEVP